MRLPHLSSITLLGLLCACQPEATTPVSAQTSPAASTTTSTEIASVVPTPVLAASTTASPTPVAASESSTAVAPVISSKSNTASKANVKVEAHPTVVSKLPVAEVVATVEKVAPTVTMPEVITKPAAPSATVLAEADALQLAKKSGCLTCHAIEKKVVGPAWLDVATKYRGDASAQSKLESKVAKGGKGTWGSMAMPANSPRVAEADIHALVSFILSLK